MTINRFPFEDDDGASNAAGSGAGNSAGNSAGKDGADGGAVKPDAVYDAGTPLGPNMPLNSGMPLGFGAGPGTGVPPRTGTDPGEEQRRQAFVERYSLRPWDVRLSQVLFLATVILGVVSWFGSQGIFGVLLLPFAIISWGLGTIFLIGMMIRNAFRGQRMFWWPLGALVLMLVMVWL